MCSSFIKAVESVCVEAVDCCRLLCHLENSSFVESVDCCRLLCALVLLKLLNVLLNLLIVVRYIMCSRELKLC